MRHFLTLLSVCGLFLATGCKDEPVEEESAGSSTKTVSIEAIEADCCVQPEFDEKPEAPALEDNYEPVPLTVASDSEAGSGEI